MVNYWIRAVGKNKTTTKLHEQQETQRNKNAHHNLLMKTASRTAATPKCEGEKNEFNNAARQETKKKQQNTTPMS